MNDMDLSTTDDFGDVSQSDANSVNLGALITNRLRREKDSVNYEKVTSTLTVPTSAPTSAPTNTHNTYCQWAIGGNGNYYPVGDAISILPSGLYSVFHDRGTFNFHEKFIKIDDLLRFPNSLTDSILKEIDSFWAREPYFKQFGFLHRRGYMFYGPAGSGKTSIVQLIISDIIKRGGIVFICEHPPTLNGALEIFRKIDPNRQIVCLFEDIDAILRHNGEDTILSLLDGENQIDKVLNIATTNYPELLDKRLVCRPRRFDRIVKVNMPDDNIRRMYFLEKLHISEKEVNEWVKATSGFSFAACAELVISVKCLGNDFADSVSILTGMMNKKISIKEFGNSTNNRLVI